MEKSPLTVKEYKIYMVGEIHWQECLKKPVNYIDGSLLNDIKTSYLLSTTTGNIHGKRKTPVSSCSWFPPFSVESNATHFPTHEAAGDLPQWNLQTEPIGCNGHSCSHRLYLWVGLGPLQSFWGFAVLPQLFLSMACLLMLFIKAFKALEQSCQRTINPCQATK